MVGLAVLVVPASSILPIENSHDSVGCLYLIRYGDRFVARYRHEFYLVYVQNGFRRRTWIVLKPRFRNY